MTQKLTQEEREIAERAAIVEEAGRLFGLVLPKKPESDKWLFSKLVESAKHWIELEDERHYELLSSLVLFSGRVRESRNTPYLFVHGPTGTGKNRIGHWLRVLCYRGHLVESPTVAALFWTIERHKPSLIIDEAEKLAPYKKNQGELAQALIEILNAGHEQDQLIPRVDKDRNQMKYYDPYGFKVILSTEDLPDTTKGRSIIINTEENVNQNIPVENPTKEDLDIKELRQYLEYYWGQFETGSVWHKDPDPCLTLEDLKLMIPNYRAVQKFGPVYRVTPDPIAQKHILELAVEDAGDRKEERGIGEDSEILQALAHAREAEQVERYTIADITKRFNEGREKWESMTTDQMGRKLRKFGLKPCRGHGGVRMIRWDEARLSRRFKRYGISLEVSPSVIVSPMLSEIMGSGDTRDTKDTSVRDRLLKNPDMDEDQARRDYADDYHRRLD